MQPTVLLSNIDRVDMPLSCRVTGLKRLIVHDFFALLQGSVTHCECVGAFQSAIHINIIKQYLPQIIYIYLLV